MSTTPITEDPDLEPASSFASDHAIGSYDYVVTHVFFPCELPRYNDCTRENDLSLIRAVCAAAHAYNAHVNGTFEPQWPCIVKMLDNLETSVRFEYLDKGHVISQLRGMQIGDILAFFIRPQNAALILTKRENCTLFESFEVSPRRDVVEATGGSLICTYPGSSIETSNELFHDGDFQSELADFLSYPTAVDSELPSPPPDRPQYITALLTGILRVLGRTVDFPRITKRVRDNVGQYPLGAGGDIGDWRRSSLWLLTRVAIQTSVERSPLGRTFYKKFILFFICTLARDPNSATLSNDLLQLILSKIFRRLNKLGSTSDWLSAMALEACRRLQGTLDDRWKPLSARPSSFRNPSQEELTRDTRCSLLNSREYIQNALVNPDYGPPNAPFHPNHCRRGTILDFLSSAGAFLDEAYYADPRVTLYDVEQVVEQDLDNWFACVTDVEEACAQLGILMDRYMIPTGTHGQWDRNPEDRSILLLTAIELFVALDKLIVKEIPIFADYSPEIPIAFLESLVLRKRTSLHRLSRAYQYLSARHSQSHQGWSVLSNKFTENSFAIRYYDQSLPLQHLKTRIEQDAMVTEHDHLPQKAAGVARNQQHLSGQQLTSEAGAFRSPLPSLSLHTKVLVFELQCPACVRTWRSAAARILHNFFYPHSYRNCVGFDPQREENLLAHTPRFQPYFVDRKGPSLSSQIHFAYFFPGGSQYPTLSYVIEHPGIGPGDNCLATWIPEHYNDRPLPTLSLQSYISNMAPTSNDVLAAQANCPTDLSVDEFIVLAHLRGGGTLRWLNVLHGLRSRTLNFRRHMVHYHLAQLAFQVGPLDLNTGEWCWHQELQDPSFCNALLDELDDLFVEVGASLIDGMVMYTISLLLIRVLASSPGEHISERTIAFLRRIRRTTFGWVQELAYDLTMAPMNEERSQLLWHMGAICRSVFDVDPTSLSKILHSAEDIAALLSCASLTHALRPEPTRCDKHSALLLERDHHLALTLEETLRAVILIDASDYGADLAVNMIFATHKPSACKWEQLQHPNARWLTCETRATRDQSSKKVHLNLLDGELLVDGQPLGELLRAIRASPECRRIFHDQGFFLVPSNLPRMDFTTLVTSSKHRLHFSLQDDDLIVQAQCDQTDDILELVPSSMLRRDLPPALVIGHVHWLNLSAKVIEIRPLERVWEQSPGNWRIDCSSDEYHVYKGHEVLVDVRSQIWEMVSKCFKCLNSFEYYEFSLDANQYPEFHPKNMLITVSPVDSLSSLPELRLSISLPRYGLFFFINEWGELESRDFQDMVYDENQSIGALFSLENLLVLRQKFHLPEELIPRRVLVPSGFLEKHGDRRALVHVRHHSSTWSESSSPLQYHTYIVDTELDCLMGNGSLTSTQYLANLHAATSSHRPDPLTGKTGAQAALCLIQSAGCRSVMELKVLNGNNYWIQTQYPQINAAHEEIEHGYYWKPTAHEAKFPQADAAEKRAAQRAAHLFLALNASGPTSLQGCNDTDYLTVESDLELENVILTLSSVIHRQSIHTHTTMNAISNWVELWSRAINVGSGAEPLPYDTPGALSSSDLLQSVMIKAQAILEKGEMACQRFQLLHLVLATAYCSQSDQAAFLSMLLAFAKEFQSHSDNILIHADCSILDGYRPTEEVIRECIRRSLPGQRHSEENWEKQYIDAAVKNLLKAWPSESPPTVSLGSVYCDMAGLTTSLQRLFSSCFRNLNLKKHLMHVLSEPGLPTIPRPVPPLKPIFNACTSFRTTLDQLLLDRPAPELQSRSVLLCNTNGSNKTPSNDIPLLNQLLSSLRTDPSIQREYIIHLDASVQHARARSQTAHRVVGENRIDALKTHYMRCRANYMDSMASLRRCLSPTNDPHEQASNRFGQWPVITADLLLCSLASTSPLDLPVQWRKCLVSLALLLLDVQRARRLLRFALDGLEEEFSRELENEGCDGWKPEDYPDWLLIQIQGNFLIRRIQADTALEMISPQSAENTVTQVNIGEGKSSVIIPIAAAALADGNQLVRVIVPKALTVQMFELLVSRLGGLANRPVYYLPFSRSLKYDDCEVISSQIDDLHRLMSQCMTERGILLVQPEHVMSLKLMAVEEQIWKCRFTVDPSPKPQKAIHSRLMQALSLKSLSELSVVGNIFRWSNQSSNYLSKEDATQVDPHGEYNGDVDSARDSAFKWLSLQRWIYSHVRDILDESDEILHSRFQLIYSIGLQQHIDGYPDRWTITQQVLGLVKKSVYSLSRNYPNFIRYGCRAPGSFPHIHIVPASDVGQDLISLIGNDVMDGELPDFSFQHLSAELIRAIRSFILDENVLSDTARTVEQFAKYSHQSYLWSGLLLLRGLLASGILLFALVERRWRVDYGLNPQLQDSEYSPLSMLAIPYRAKDVPAPNTQFGHPDITIILTCLSYYYTGLSEKQLRLSFEILLDEDDPCREYSLWLKEYDCESLPGHSLHKLDKINLRSSERWDKVIFPLFHRNKKAVDFYLSRVVFPQKAKEFPWKLSGSSWDLAEKREKLITGFSGTNDGQWLLPMSIAQRDLDHQRGTNARVLAYFLQPENNYYMVAHMDGKRLSTPEFLQMVTAQQPEIRVLLDVGAQILDSSNTQVAQAWLEIASNTAAAIYFDENDELMVLTKNGITQSLLSSPLSQQLNRCVVYLDHAHTRGTDITFPVGSRAAVTLGPKVTKDNLVQGCMRMRKLGHGHLVMFFAPLEVDRSIRSLVGKKDPNIRVTTIDILRWAIHETWTDIQQRTPYWAQQGMSHKSRHEAWTRFCNVEISPEQLSDAWLQPELKSLHDLYAPSETKNTGSSLPELDPGIRQRCRDLGVLSLPNAQLEEEQEREVHRERERERELELPPSAQPAEHHLHPDVIKFVKTGIIPPLHSNCGFHPVFTTLEESSAATRDADVWSPYILATADFCKTIKPESTRGTMDQYLRPVQWILSRGNLKDRDQVLILLSPYEADCLMPDIRTSEHVHLHIYAPRTSQRMKPSDDLKLYSIPPLPSDWTPPWALIDQLNVFAGQLYLSDYESYLRLCRSIDVPTKDSPSNTPVRRNLFNIPGSFEENEIRFLDSPLPSVMALLTIRTRGKPFAHTHMGKILQGQLLTQEDFERPTSVVSDHRPVTCGMQTSHDVAVESIAPLHSDIDCDMQDSHSSLVLSRSKRGLGISDTASGPPQKRLRAN